MVERTVVEWLDGSDKNKSNVIYMLIFPNWKYYIGLTGGSLEKRIKKHLIVSNTPKTKKERAIIKYKTFYVIVLDSGVSLDELKKKEKYWIELYDTFKNGYNSTTGGDVYILDEVSCKKISDANSGKPKSDKTRSKMSESNKGKHSIQHISDDRRNRMRESRYIKCRSMPDDILFDSIKQCVEYYKLLYGGFNIRDYLNNNKTHKKSGQTFITIKS